MSLLEDNKIYSFLKLLKLHCFGVNIFQTTESMWDKVITIISKICQAGS